MTRLTDDPADLRLCIWIVDAPGITLTFACNFPGVVILDASSAERLQSGEVANAGRVRRCVEVAGDDGWKRLPVTRVEIRQRNDLPFPGFPRRAATR